MTKYNWKRFWCQRGETPKLTDNGYLLDPGLEYAHFYTDVVTYDQIAGIPCLVLLGEPGIGKSTAMQAHYEEAKQQLLDEGGKALCIDLNQYASEIRLIDDIFQHRDFLDWQENKRPFHLFLDSLDECKLRINTVSEILKAKLSEVSPCDNLFLRIACRTVDWPLNLEDGFKRVWEEDSLGIYELAPLRRIDIEVAAQENDIVPIHFLDAVEHIDVVPLATKPVTLNFLLKRFKRDHKLSETQIELYYEGCRLLCEEINESRLGAGLTGNYPTDDRLQAAMWIAAAMVFSNHPTLWTGPDMGNVPESDLALHQLTALKADRQAVLTEPLIRETLGTGLFTSRGPSRFGWAHQTYAEFLAAYCVYEQETLLESVMSLIVSGSDDTGKIIPQLSDTAAWLAALRQDVCEEILRSDPEVLLKSDLSNSASEMRAKIVAAVLNLYDEKRQLQPQSSYQQYRNLNHPGLASQLREYIRDREKNLYVRRAAINIAKVCEVSALQEDLVAMALDPAEGYLRADAAYVVLRIGDDAFKAQLKPLALGIAGPDDDDELKGYGLLAVWPNHLTTEELFNTLSYPKRSNLLGHYKLFLRGDFVDDIPIDELPIALKWVQNQSLMPGPKRNVFQDAINAIMRKAWNNINEPAILQAFTEAVLSRLARHDAIVRDERRWNDANNGIESGKESFKQALFLEHSKRRKVLLAALPLLNDPGQNLFWLTNSETPLCIPEDLVWLLNIYQTIEDKNIQNAILKLAEAVFNWRNPAHLEVILSIRDIIPELYSKLEHFLYVELDSPQVELWQNSYNWQQEQKEHEYHQAEQISVLITQIDKLLAQSKEGDAEAWWQIYLALIRDPRSTHLDVVGAIDITITPVWEDADEALRDALINAAKQYIEEYEPNPQEQLKCYLEENTLLFWPIYGGLAALLLLLQESAEHLDHIATETWKAWAPFVAVYPISPEDQTFQQLVKICYQHAPDEMIDGLLTVIQREDKNGNILRRFEESWDERLSNILLDMVIDETLHPNSIRTILCGLMERRVPDARSFAESVICPPYKDQVAEARAVAAAQVLLQYADDAGWGVVWPAFQADTEFADKVISGIVEAPSRGRTQLENYLNEEQLADFYIWLANQYPRSEDPYVEGGHMVTSREEVGNWRNAILYLLQNKGTFEAVESIKRIKQKFPDDDWLNQVLANAQEIAHRQSWDPPQPEKVVALLNRQDGRLIKNGNQLLDVLLESLKRLESKLQSETPAAIFLWNEVGDKCYRPKTENEFSDFVKLHLEEDLKRSGIVLNREVEIRSGTGGASGERTDIIVDAVTQSSSGEGYNTITAIIEVKGNWHRELKSAMKEQLVDRYLKDNVCRHGLYLVGWFTCSQWDVNDSRQQAADRQFTSLDEAEQYFAEQATKLSQDDLCIHSVVINASLR
ncbi:MAG: hypothetical protein JXJ17_14165 [Anaerolineae bacterium]|nr:hypothetical protein [Anaerolineae bacterium]